MTSDISHQASTVLSKLVTVHVLSASTTRQAQRRRRKWLTFSINEQDLTSLSRDRVKSSLSRQSTALIVTIKLTPAKKIRTKTNTKASQVDLVRDTTNHKNLLSVDQQSTVWAALMCECVSIQHRTVVTILLFSSVDRYCSNVDRWRRTADVQRGVQSSSQWSVVSGHHGLSSEWSVVSVFCPVSGQWSVVSGHCVLSSQWSVVSVSCPVSSQWSVVSGHYVLSSEWPVVSGQWSLCLVQTGRSEDGDGGADKIQREDPEAQTIDDHRRELPVVGFLFTFHVVLDLLGDVAQLAQYRQQFTAHARHRHRISVSGGRRPPVEGALEAARDGQVIDRNGVVDVLDVRDEADRRRSLRLEVAHARLALEKTAGKVAAWTWHAQCPGQPLAQQSFYLATHDHTRRRRQKRLTGSYNTDVPASQFSLWLLYVTSTNLSPPARGPRSAVSSPAGSGLPRSFRISIFGPRCPLLTLAYCPFCGDVAKSQWKTPLLLEKPYTLRA